MNKNRLELEHLLKAANPIKSVVIGTASVL